MVMKAVLTLSRKVKMIIDTPKLTITMYGVALLRPLAPAPITTGNNGKIHGAKTVSMPAKNEITRNVMGLFNFSYNSREITTRPFLQHGTLTIDFDKRMLTGHTILLFERHLSIIVNF